MSIKIFFCYAHRDERLLNNLKEHLITYKRKGDIDFWYDRDINAGTDWQQEINQHLNEAQIILLFVSSYFTSSDYCTSIELKQALELHKKGKARVIPIILRHVDWSQEPFGHLQALPKDGKPITAWNNQHEAFKNVGEEIYKAVQQLILHQVPGLSGTLDEEMRQLGQQLAPPQPFELPAVSENKQRGVAKLTHVAPTVQQGSQVYSFKSPFTVEKRSLRNMFINHRVPVENVAISTNGKILVRSGIGNTIEIWNFQTGQLENTLTRNSSPVQSVAISANGQMLISGLQDGTIKVWDPYSERVVRTLAGHSRPVLSLAISPNEQILASGSADSTIKVWNLLTGEIARTCRGHFNSVWSVAINPDGQTFVSGSADSTIKVWNLFTGQLLDTLTGHSGPVWSIVISSKEQTLLSGSADATIKKWQISTYPGQLLHTFTDPSRTSLSGSVMSVAISPDGKTLVSGGADCKIKVWDIFARKLAQSLNGHSRPITSVAISPDGKTLASGSRDMTIKLWGS